MEGYGTMPGAAMACMTASLLIAFGLPLGLGLFFRRRGGRWRAFLLGAAVFLVFALVLEQRAHQLILGGPAGGVITGDLGLYALYGGLMAGLFEETGRFAAFQLLRRSGKGGTPQDALIYGAGHGGMEAVLLVGLTNVSNLLLSFWLNTGTLEQHMGQLDDAAARRCGCGGRAAPHLSVGRAGADRGRCPSTSPCRCWSGGLWRLPGVPVALPRGHCPPRGGGRLCHPGRGPYAPGGGGAGGAGLGCGPGRAGTVDLAAEREKIFMK